MKIGGLDIGTTGCKLTVFDENGKFLGRAYRDYPVRRGADAHTLDASALMDGVYGVIREMASQVPDLGGFGVTSFGETFVLTDEKGIPLEDCMLDTDKRGSEECHELEERLGSRHIVEIAGVRPHEMYSLPKLMWVKKHQPDLYARAAHAFLIEDYVVFMLTGVAQIDYSLATRTMAFDIRKLDWSDEIFGEAGIDRHLFSKPVPTGTPAGPVNAETMAKTGLSGKTVVVSISHDQIAAAVGAGVFDAGTAVDGAGTVECLTPVYAGVPPMEPMYDGNYAVVPYVVPGTYVTYAFSYTGGALIQWFTETLAGREKSLAEAEGISVNEYLERQYAESRGQDTPSGLLVLPHFAGAATPYMDTGSRGVIAGLTAASTAADIYRGCLEGVVYEMCLNVEHLEKSGLQYHRIRATGGGAKSALWMQMKADMLNVPVEALRTPDAGTVGSAMLTGAALGYFGNLQEAAEQMVEVRRTFEPRLEMHEKYRKIYERYRELYEAVRPLM